MNLSDINAHIWQIAKNDMLYIYNTSRIHNVITNQIYTEKYFKYD